MKREVPVEQLQEEAMMKVRRFSEAQVVRILQELDYGMLVVQAPRKNGVSPATVRCWKAKHLG
jgi:hypothetical protein